MQKIYITAVAPNDAAAEDFIEQKLAEHTKKYLEAVLAEATKMVKFHAIDESQTIVGALYGLIHWNALQINALWVEEGYRRQGLGEALFKRAEQEARKVHCKYIFTETASFEVPKFYFHMGFSVIGTVEDFPEGYQYYYLKKRLVY